MSQYDPTLSVLGIPDHNIKVAFVRHEYRGNGVRRRQYHVIDAELTYRLTRCPLCGLRPCTLTGFTQHTCATQPHDRRSHDRANHEVSS